MWRRNNFGLELNIRKAYQYLSLFELDTACTALSAYRTLPVWLLLVRLVRTMESVHRAPYYMPMKLFLKPVNVSNFPALDLSAYCRVTEAPLTD
jgi:hypothetical protein